MSHSWRWGPSCPFRARPRPLWAFEWASTRSTRSRRRHSSSECETRTWSQRRWWGIRERIWPNWIECAKRRPHRRRRLLAFVYREERPKRRREWRESRRRLWCCSWWRRARRWRVCRWWARRGFAMRRSKRSPRVWEIERPLWLCSIWEISWVWWKLSCSRFDRTGRSRVVRPN